MTDQKGEVEEFPPNSRSQKEEPQEESKKIIKQVATAKRIVKRKTFLNNLLNGTLNVVGTYILFEVLIPAAKNTLSDMINNASDMILFGEPKTRRRDRDRDRLSPRVSYSNYYERDRDRDRDRGYGRERREGRERYGRKRFDSDEVLLASREEADDLLQAMYEIFDQYNAVTVSEFLELAGLPDEYTDQNYGWQNLRDVQVRRVRDGYVIELPMPKALPK
jgi:hypothetical protein